MTDPVGVTEDPRKVLMLGDEPDTVAELMDLAYELVTCAVHSYCIHTSPSSFAQRLHCATLENDANKRLEAAIRTALEAQ